VSQSAEDFQRFFVTKERNRSRCHGCELRCRLCRRWLQWAKSITAIDDDDVEGSISRRDPFYPLYSSRAHWTRYQRLSSVNALTSCCHIPHGDGQRVTVWSKSTGVRAEESKTVVLVRKCIPGVTPALLWELYA